GAHAEPVIGPGREEGGTDMSIRKLVAALAVIAGVLGLGLTAAQALTPSRYIVRFEDDAVVEEVVAALTSTGADVTEVYTEAIPGAAIRVVASQENVIRALPGVDSVERDRRIRSFAS